MNKKELMSWENCLTHHIKRIQKDKNRANELIKMADLRYEFWKKHHYDKKYVSLVVDGYYEVIKEMLTALLYTEGFKSGNHECLIAFFKHKYPEFDYESDIIYQLKNIRNEISYRGFFVKPEYFEMNKIEFQHIIKTLRKIIME
ncbi:MAG: hypothetical protein KKF46_04995 [Nanoarchaeota archaeon]|nr:hypothetical protein [Nanoarchaeota archaeon]MBU1321690.1 hypothetical protein [Nanoarchaeota archaeon]MBU1598069.1 hypothetical protein [Nanoarchaeota archaeon]MBU2441639.1 hypothetical protein [Nanoarchaeota archaeon]